MAGARSIGMEYAAGGTYLLEIPTHTKTPGRIMLIRQDAIGPAHSVYGSMHVLSALHACDWNRQSPYN